jgi:transposase-like protein
VHGRLRRAQGPARLDLGGLAPGGDQTCVVHLIRASFRYAGRQDWDKISRALKPVYTAPTSSAAEDRFLEFQEEWGAKYPAIVRLWENAWAEFVPFLQFDTEIRRVVCTTNAIESVNARIRKPSGPAATSRTSPQPSNASTWPS